MYLSSDTPVSTALYWQIEAADSGIERKTGMKIDGLDKKRGFFDRRWVLIAGVSAVMAAEAMTLSAWGEEGARVNVRAEEENSLETEEGVSGNTAETESSVETAKIITVEYDNLRQLLLDGNLDLRQANDSYESTKKNYQELMEQMREQQAYMKFLADKYEDTEDGATYSMNAGILGGQASMLSKRIEAINRKTQTLTVEDNTDSYTMAAQSVMNSYNQMALNVKAKEKSVQAKEAAYEAMVKRQSVGAATAAEVMEAADQLSSEQNLLGSYRQQEAQLRFRLLAMLGLEDQEGVMIGTIPDPDLAEIDQVNFEEDKQRAINNSSTVQSVRHSRAGSTAEISRKSDQETEAVGNAEAEFLEAYQKLQAGKLEYQAAKDSYESAKISYDSLQKKRQAGMVSQTEYLEEEASYLEALAKRGIASMNLTQTLEDYQWLVKGTESTRR